MVIYKITNKVNNKVYIGQTSRSVDGRWQNHCKQKGQHRSLIRNAVQKYGQDAFTVETIDTADSLEELNRKEVHWIKILNTLAPNGYNLDSGGKRKEIHKLTKIKMSAAKIGTKFSMSEKGRKNISTGKKGKTFSTKHKNALSAARKDKKKIKCATTGYVYESISDAAEKLQLNISGISRCINGKRKSCGGLIFELVHD